MFSIHYFAESASVVLSRLLRHYSDRYRRFRGTFSIHIKVEEKTLVSISLYQTARRYLTDDHTLNIDRGENLKSRVI